MALAAIALYAQAPPADSGELVRQSVVNGDKAWEKARQYEYTKVTLEEQFDSQGRVTSKDDDVYHGIPVHGIPFEIHVSHDGAPLAASNIANQERKLAELRQQTEAEAARRRDREKAARSYFREIPDAFDFRLVGEEELPTGPAWVLEATPRPGFEPRSRYAHVFPKMTGKLWIDRKDIQWVKADAVATSTVTFGFLIARLARGSRIILEQTRLPDGTWVPRRLAARASARTFVFFNRNFRQEFTYENFHRPAAPAVSSR